MLRAKEGPGRVLSEVEGDQTRFALENHHFGYCAVDYGALKDPLRRKALTGSRPEAIAP